MSDTQDPQQEKVEILDVKALNESLQVVNVSLNLATKQGTFDMDNAVKVKMSFNNLVQGIANLEKCQNLLVKLNENSKKQQEQAQL